MAPPPSLRLLRSLVLLLVVAMARPALAGDLALQVRPGVSLTGTDTANEAGGTTSARALQYLQRNDLMLRRELFPLLNITANGTYDFSRGTLDNDGQLTRYAPQSWNARGQLNWGMPLLNASLAYDRREGFSDIQSGLGRYTLTKPVMESVSGRAGWRPHDLPTVDFTISRSRIFDTLLKVENRTVDAAALTFAYRPEKRFQLNFRSAWMHRDDVLHQVETTELTNALAVTWGDRFFDNRVGVNVAYNAGTRAANTIHASASATVELPRAPVAGLSVVETIPLTPDRVVLSSNPALIDGNFSASAGVNLGFGPSGDNDTVLRDVGAQFRPGEGAVNTVQVWVDKALPVEVAAAFTWEAWQSDDNLTWTPLRITAPVGFSLFSNRFEITVESTSAPYLKVATHPLAVGVTSDTALREILVTEVQFFEVVAAKVDEALPLRVFGNFSGSVKVLLLKGPNRVSYDGSLFLVHGNAPTRVSYAIMNGLSYDRRLTRKLAVSARLERTDSDEGYGHHALNRFGASLTVDLLRTLKGSFSYSGQLTERAGAVGYNQSVGAFARAELYKGIDTFASASIGGGTADTGQSSLNTAATLGVALVPMKRATLNLGFTTGRSTASGGGRSELDTTRTLLDANATVTPFRSLALSGGVSVLWTQQQAEPVALANFSGAFSPFQGGDLQARFVYQETLSTGGELRTRSWGPALRWNIRPGWYLDAGYNHADSLSPAVRTTSFSLFANLVLSLR